MFKPVNRYLHIEISPTTSPETESGILLPSDFKPAEEKYTSAVVISSAEDVKFADLLTNGTSVLVDKSMIESVNFSGKSIDVVLENYILGILH
jgi:co-chaperonin GroES (HSP10)|tara:strand:+ start:2769 stop:3047 length:279 start_codon:yes stop_codon:yes gene_type:complete